jgi:hypothetical protein
MSNRRIHVLRDYCNSECECDDRMLLRRGRATAAVYEGPTPIWEQSIRKISGSMVGFSKLYVGRTASTAYLFNHDSDQFETFNANTPRFNARGLAFERFSGKNEILYSDPANSGQGSGYTNVTCGGAHAWGTGVLTNAVLFPADANAKAWTPNVTHAANTLIVSCFVKMDDNSIPRVGTSANSNVDLSISCGGTITPASGHGPFIMRMGTTNIYRVWGAFTKSSGTYACGLVADSNYSQKAFRASGLQVSIGWTGWTSFGVSEYVPTAGATATVVEPSGGLYTNSAGDTITYPISYPVTIMTISNGSYNKVGASAANVVNHNKSCAYAFISRGATNHDYFFYDHVSQSMRASVTGQANCNGQIATEAGTSSYIYDNVSNGTPLKGYLSNPGSDATLSVYAGQTNNMLRAFAVFSGALTISQMNQYYNWIESQYPSQYPVL